MHCFFEQPGAERNARISFKRKYLINAFFAVFVSRKKAQQNIYACSRSAYNSFLMERKKTDRELLPLSAQRNVPYKTTFLIGPPVSLLHQTSVFFKISISQALRL